MPTISVVIPVFNASQFLEETLISVFNQTYKDFEIIVVDDGSTDDTNVILSPYLDKISYIYQKNQGPAIARNTGIKATKGEWIAFLDSDDIWVSTKLEEHVNHIKDNPSINFLFSDAMLFDGKAILKTTMMNRTNSVQIGSLAEKLRGLKENDGTLLKCDLFDQLVRLNNPIITSSVVVRKHCLEEVKCFNEKMCQWSEDSELWIRLSRKQAMHYVNKSLLKYRYNPSGVSGTNNNRKYRYDFGDAMGLDLNYLIFPANYLQKTKKRIVKLYFNAIWGFFREKQYDYVIRACLRTLRYNLIQPKVVLYLLIAYIKNLLKRDSNCLKKLN